MIKFRVNPVPVWVSGDHREFDSSEIGQYSKEERKGIKFLINPLTRQLTKELVSKHTTKKPIEFPSEMNESFEKFIELTGGIVEDFDDVAYQNDVIDRVICNWNLLGEDEKTIECTRENKLNLLNGGYPQLAVCIIRIARIITSNFEQFEQKKEKDSVKNLLSSQSGLVEEEKK